MLHTGKSQSRSVPVVITPNESMAAVRYAVRVIISASLRPVGIRRVDRPGRPTTTRAGQPAQSPGQPESGMPAARSSSVLLFLTGRPRSAEQRVADEQAHQHADGQDN